MQLLIQIVDFDQSNSSGVVYAGHDRGVVPGCRFAMIADSLAAVGAWPLFWISLTWLLVIIPPIIVVCQSSLLAISAPPPLCSSNLGLAKASVIPNWVSSGPMARMMTLFGPVPWTIKPPIITCSPVWTKLRVLMLPRLVWPVWVRS
jgi:hypothetical protein